MYRVVKAWFEKNRKSQNTAKMYKVKWVRIRISMLGSTAFILLDSCQNFRQIVNTIPDIVNALVFGRFVDNSLQWLHVLARLPQFVESSPSFLFQAAIDELDWHAIVAVRRISSLNIVRTANDAPMFITMTRSMTCLKKRALMLIRLLAVLTMLREDIRRTATIACQSSSSIAAWKRKLGKLSTNCGSLAKTWSHCRLLSTKRPKT